MAYRGSEREKLWRKQYWKKYYIKNKERLRAYGRNKYHTVRKLGITPEIRKANSLKAKKHRDKTKEFVVKGYGGKCNCCGELNVGFLTLDHVNNDGYKKKRPNGRRYSGFYTYRLAIKNNYPREYRLLCYNCNCGRQSNGGVCPHNKC